MPLCVRQVLWIGCRRMPKPELTRENSSGERRNALRSEEHTSELQSRENLVCRLLLEKKNYGRRFGKLTLFLQHMTLVALQRIPVPFCVGTFDVVSDQCSVVIDIPRGLTARQSTHLA